MDYAYFTNLVYLVVFVVNFFIYLRRVGSWRLINTVK